MESYTGVVQTAHDALILLEASRLGYIPRIKRRLKEEDRRRIQPGHVYIWNEREAKMRRWTDGRSWSASRVTGSFLTYREMETKEDICSSFKYKADGFIKQSFSITTMQGDKLHLIAYTTTKNFSAAKFHNRYPTKDPKLKDIVIPQSIYPQADSLISMSFSTFSQSRACRYVGNTRSSVSSVSSLSSVSSNSPVSSPLNSTSPESPLSLPQPASAMTSDSAASAEQQQPQTKQQQQHHHQKNALENTSAYSNSNLHVIPRTMVSLPLLQLPPLSISTPTPGDYHQHGSPGVVAQVELSILAQRKMRLHRDDDMALRHLDKLSFK